MSEKQFYQYNSNYISKKIFFSKRQTNKTLFLILEVRKQVAYIDTELYIYILCISFSFIFCAFGGTWNFKQYDLLFITWLLLAFGAYANTVRHCYTYVITLRRFYAEWSVREDAAIARAVYVIYSSCQNEGYSAVQLREAFSS